MGRGNHPDARGTEPFSSTNEARFMLRGIMEGSAGAVPRYAPQRDQNFALTDIIVVLPRMPPVGAVPTVLAAYWNSIDSRGEFSDPYA